MNDSPELPLHHPMSQPYSEPSNIPMSSTCPHLSRFFDHQFAHAVQAIKHNQPINQATGSILPTQLVDLQTLFAYYTHIRKSMSKRPANRFVPSSIAHQPSTQSQSPPANQPNGQSAASSSSSPTNAPPINNQSPTPQQSSASSVNPPPNPAISSKPRCASCNKSSVRLALCVGCQYIGCITPAGQSSSSPSGQTPSSPINPPVHGHAKKHADEYQHWCWLEIGIGEEISTYQSTNASLNPASQFGQPPINQTINDSMIGQIYCVICKDFVYHSGIQLIASVSQLIQHRKRLSVDVLDFSPDDQSIIQQFSTTINQTVNQPVNELLIGIRGIVNLGQTCYLSVVIQSIVQNPLLRNYFLSDLHNEHRCSIRRAINQTASTSLLPSSTCFACDFDDLFTQFYSINGSTPPSSSSTFSQSTPITPHRLLTSLWCRIEGLMGAAQHDAHECLIGLIDGLHENLSQQSPNPTTPPDCRCLAHMVFGSQLRSEVRCAQCGLSSPSIEPVFDYSLDWQTIRQSIPPATSLQNNSPISEPITPTLLGCFTRFTAPETIDRFQCARCANASSNASNASNSSNPSNPPLNPSVSPPIEGSATKQLSFQTLPLCLIVHFKRFEQAFTQSKSGKSSVSSIKNDEFVDFPLSDLDLSPYVYTPTAQKDHPSANPTQPPLPPSLYHCYCVIVHKGSLETGHYWCYFRRDNSWYKMDDRVVTRVSTQEVKGAKAYLLFYTKAEITRFG